jgi:hypothetical protein
MVLCLQLRPVEVTLLALWRQMAALDYSLKAAELSCLISVNYSDGCYYPNVTFGLQTVFMSELFTISWLGNGDDLLDRNVFLRPGAVHSEGDGLNTQHLQKYPIICPIPKVNF